MTLLDALQIFNTLEFNGPEQTAIWTRASAIEAEGVDTDDRAFILAVEEFAAEKEAN